MSCEFYKRLAEGPLARVVKGKWEHFIKALKLLLGVTLPDSSVTSSPSRLVEAVEFVVNLFKHGLARELVELIKAAKSTGQCDKEVKKAAEKLGVNEEWLRTLAKNLASLPEVDLSQLEERARALERELDLLKRLSPHLLDLTQLFIKEDGRLLVESPFGVVEYVEVGVEDEVRRAFSYGRVVVVYGPRGVGKSTTALKAIYDFSIPQPHREVIVVRVGENWKDAIKAARQLLNGPFIPVLYYDTLEVWGYRRSEEGVDVLYSAMAHVEPLADFLREAAKLGVPTVVVLAEEDYRAYEDAVKRVGAEVVHLGGEAEALVRGILRGVPDAVAEAVLEMYRGEFYAVAAAMAKALYEEWRDPARVAEAVKRLDVYSLALAYLWHVVLGGDEATAWQVAPLILATGFYGPHPPKLARAIVKAFGGVPVSRVVKWLAQPLHGIIYETIRRVAHDAVYRRFGIGSYELCQDNAEGPCLLVEIYTEAFVGVPRKRYSYVEEVVKEYAKLVAKALKAPGPAGVRQIDFLIDDFLHAFNGVAEDGCWRIRYETKGPKGVKLVEDVVDELDIIAALCGLAVLPEWYPQLKSLEGWFFVGSNVVATVERYLYPLLSERDRELVERAAIIVNRIAERDGYTDVDLWRAVCIAAAGRWDGAADEELEKAVELVANALNRFATASHEVLKVVKPLLSETWHRVISGEAQGGGIRRQRLADKLTRVVYNAARGYPRSLPHFFVPEKEEPDPETVAKRFAALYNAVSNAGKLHLLDTLLHILYWHDIVAMLLDYSQLKLEDAFVEVARYVEEFVSHSHFDNVERAYAVVRLYPRLARLYASFGKFGKAVELVEESLKALRELRSAYENSKTLTEERLRPYLELRRVDLDLGKELDELSWHVYSHATHVYITIDDLKTAQDYAKKMREIASEKLGDVYYVISSDILLLGLETIRDGVPPVEKFSDAWERALQFVGVLGAENIAAALGNYVVALAYKGRRVEVEKVLKEWGWALELIPLASTLTYGVLSLFDEKYLQKAGRGFVDSVDLARLANVLYNDIEADLFAKEELDEETTNTLKGETPASNELFLSVLVGLAYCKRGEERGLELARAAAWRGSTFVGIVGRLFDELYKALEGVEVGNCVTDRVLKAVYKLYYYHV